MGACECFPPLHSFSWAPCALSSVKKGVASPLDAHSTKMCPLTQSQHGLALAHFVSNSSSRSPALQNTSSKIRCQNNSINSTHNCIRSNFYNKSLCMYILESTSRFCFLDLTDRYSLISEVLGIKRCLAKMLIFGPHNQTTSTISYLLATARITTIAQQAVIHEMLA